MAIELPDGRSESNDILEALRLRAVHARELGYAVVDIATILVPARGLIFGLATPDISGTLLGTGRWPMNKKYIVRLSDEERAVCQDVVKRLKGTSEKVKRAQILLKADADGPGWPDEQIAEAYDCSVRTVENLRERLVTAGFDAALERKRRATPPTPRKLDGEGEAKLIAMRLGKPPAGYGRWSLQLLADELVALEVVSSICAETVRKALKKTG
jgi:transposase